MSDIKGFSQDVLAIDWRNESPEDVCDMMNDYMESYDCFEITIDDLRNAGVGDVDICDIMQCYNIYTTMSMV